MQESWLSSKSRLRREEDAAADSYIFNFSSPLAADEDSSTFILWTGPRYRTNPVISCFLTPRIFQQSCVGGQSTSKYSLETQNFVETGPAWTLNSQSRAAFIIRKSKHSLAFRHLGQKFLTSSQRKTIIFSVYYGMNRYYHVFILAPDSGNKSTRAKCEDQHFDQNYKLEISLLVWQQSRGARVCRIISISSFLRKIVQYCRCKPENSTFWIFEGTNGWI